MGVKIRENVKPSGIKSLYLDISSNGKRYKEYLGLSLKPAKTTEERDSNKETKRLAESIRAKRELELQAQEYEYTPVFKTNVDFVAYYQKHLDEYTNKDKRIVKYSLEWFKKFLESENIKSLRPKDLTPELCKKYLNKMQENLNGETPYNYFTKFKSLVRKAKKDKLLIDDPTEDIKVIRDEGLKKDILDFKEIQKLAGAYCGNDEVKRAFLFSLNTGLRWCDIKEIQFRNIDFSSRKLSMKQAKTKHNSKNSIVTIDLNNTALKLIGEKQTPEQKIFTLPSHTGALKILKNWKNKAGIDKHITWHCSRHSFAVNLLGEVKTDIKTLASLLGHSGLKHTEKYTRAVDSLKNKAVNGLPEIDL
jgi:integrase